VQPRQRAFGDVQTLAIRGDDLPGWILDDRPIKPYWPMSIFCGRNNSSLACAK